MAPTACSGIEPGSGYFMGSLLWLFHGQTKQEDEKEEKKKELAEATVNVLFKTFPACPFFH